MLSADARGQDPPYMAYWLSTFHHLQLSDAVRVALRWSNGAPTIEQVQQQIRQQQQPDQGANADSSLGKRKVWAFMESIRGSAAYWSRSAKDLFAMYRALGSATWFVTLSANDFHWDDLAIVLLKMERAKAGLPELSR